MASRPQAGARPGAKFAQFKLVLLGMLLDDLLSWLL
jgi:hypothetical protein